MRRVDGNISSVDQDLKINKQFNSFIYDITISVLALIVVIILLLEVSFNLTEAQLKILGIIDITILVIFYIDYIVRLLISKSKLTFIKQNIIDLVSIIPLNSLFKALRAIKIIKIIKMTKLVKLTRLVRLVAVITKFKNKVDKFLCTNGLNRILLITIIVVLLGAIGISLAENMGFADSIWWSLVTATTVGYGDISPSTPIGRVIAVILMLVGIGTIGMLTGTIATYFSKYEEHKEPKTYKDEIVENAIIRLSNFENMNVEELEQIFTVLKSIKRDV